MNDGSLDISDTIASLQELLSDAQELLRLGEPGAEQAVQDAAAALDDLRGLAAHHAAPGPSARASHEAPAPAASPARAVAPLAEPLSRPGKRTAHPASRYAHAAPDFAALAAKHPSLALHVTVRRGRGHIDFADWRANRELTRALLIEDFGLRDWTIPEGHLVPAIPNRLNYVLWLRDLLALSSRGGAAGVHGVDIGTGANLVYPLLGAAVCGWRFTAVDNDAAALAAASANLRRNPHLAPLITLRPSEAPASAPGPPADGGPTGQAPARLRVLEAALQPGESYDFCMCNPPFFEHTGLAAQNPDTSYGGTANEMACAGGEAAFAGAMVDESGRLRAACHWFTCMLGRKATFKALRQRLNRMPGVTGVRTTELVQGRTSRWAIAWSFVVPKGLAAQPLPRVRDGSPASKRPCP